MYKKGYQKPMMQVFHIQAMQMLMTSGSTNVKGGATLDSGWIVSDDDAWSGGGSSGSGSSLGGGWTDDDDSAWE